MRHGISYLQLQQPNHPFELPGDGYIGYTPHLGFALVPGPPVAAEPAWTPAVQAFEQHAHGQGLHPAFCGIGEFGARFFSACDYRLLKVGDEAVVPLAQVDLRGRRWQECRTALNRARQRRLQFAWAPPREPDGALLRELRQVSDEWLRRKRLPELGFSLGSFRSVLDPACRVGVARDADGRLVGFVSWTPVPGRNAWMADLMRYRSGVMAGLMDFLVVRSLLDFRAEGYTLASLGGVPLSNVGATPGGWLRGVLDLVFARVQEPYSARSLLHYKRKFNPTWEPMYLACEHHSRLPLALLALLTASMPGLGPAQALRAAVAPLLSLLLPGG